LYIGGTALGGLLGRLLTGVLSDFGGWSLALGGIAGLGLLACVLFIWLLPASRHFEAQPLSFAGLLGNFGRHLRNADLRGLFFLSFVLMGSFVALFNYIGFYLSAEPFSLSGTLIGFLFLVYLLGIWSSNVAGKQVSKRGARPVLLGSLLMMLVGVLLCLLPLLSFIVAGLALFTSGFFAAHAVASGLVGQRAEGARAQASALYLCAYYLGSSILGYSMGWVWEQWGWLPLLVCLALAVLLGMARAWRL
jgi:YNFM family putative membrane transporter